MAAPIARHVFADGLVLPTGVMRWKQGMLVTAAPTSSISKTPTMTGVPTCGA